MVGRGDGRGGGRGYSQRGGLGDGSGRGRGRGRGRGDDRRSGRGAGVCFKFQNTGRCDRGPDCPYLHNTNGGQQPAQRAARSNETGEQQHARQSYNSWKRLLGETPDDSSIMRRVWQGALNILEDGDRDWIQQLPQDLDDDDETHRGRLHVLAMLSAKVIGGDYDAFITNSRNFLLTMTHDSLVRCLAVDTHVSSIYNLFGGLDGKRALAFLRRLCEALLAARTAGHPTLSSEDVDATLQAMAAALVELLKRERRARFNDDLPALVDSLQKTTTVFTNDIPTNSSTRIVDRLDDIRAMIIRARMLLAADPSGDDSDASDDGKLSSYPREVIVPSNRHDNDKRDITEITIFPTRDEIMSDAKEFLPYTDPDQPHFLADAVQRHIDTYFRLLRHDIFGELKNALAGLMHTVSQDSTALSDPKLNLSDMRTYQYTNAYVSYVSFKSRRGLQAQIAFVQPALIRKKTPVERQKWWEESRRFEEGSVLSFIWLQDSVVQHIFLSVSERITDPTKEYGLASSQHKMAFITANLVTQDRSTFKTLMQANSHKAHGVLLEFPKVMPATFVPVLENLKAMQRLNRLPFRQWIIPSKHDGSSESKKVQEVPPPLYARTAGFSFPLKALLRGGNDALCIEPKSSCDDEELVERLEARTQLDHGQCRALIAALTCEFAFIQGPPGTGKSFLGLQLMKILLDIKKKADLGPILVVCYTNHALDQFLEHLLDIGVKKVIRVGGQSRSEKLEDHNLRRIRQSETKTKAERYLAARNYEKMDEDEMDADSAFAVLRGLQKRAEWKNLETYIHNEHPGIYSQFRNVDDDNFQLVGRNPFDIWRTAVALNNSQAFSAKSAAGLQLIIQKATRNVYSLSTPERGALLAHWSAQAQSEKVGELFEIIDGASKTQRELNNIHEEANRRILQEADVIGVTTSGLAKRIAVLQHIKCKVIVCEEAGEVMEPHMLSAFLPDVEHCIQIGDHEQLRPSVNNFRDLSLESERGKLHQLDRSQFERLSVGEQGRPRMPVAQLNVQRRMRPEISTLIRETKYEKLIDHSSTMDLPNVIGMRKNVFWLNHENFENEKAMDVQHSKSKSNDWEVQMVHALVRHIVRQGEYKSDQIAVLTPYTGQLQKLRAAMRSSFEIVLSDRDQEALEKDGFEVGDAHPDKAKSPGPQDHRRRPLEKKTFSELLRVATVDNFQGEEARIIIISLVRSNEKKNVGFLKTTNRINVLLSRAQHGMYLLGNTNTYSSVDMWQKVISMLRAKDSVGESLALCCPRHPDTVIEIQQPDDFPKFSPEGGCREACTDRLDCGHRCQARCHSAQMHAVFQCEQPCQRRHKPCDHECQKPTCGESCGKCMILLDNVHLPCGHFKNSVPCYLTLNLASISCDVKVSKLVPGCEHNVTLKCSQDVTKAGFRCPTPCTTSLPCSHTCPGSCGRCHTADKDSQPKVEHLTCTKRCGRKLGTCHHNCSRLCHDGTDCGLCQQPCEVRCKHNKCPQKCHEPCAPCVELCVWSCEHQGDCTMPCSAPCNRLPCDERCTKLLPCGHQCPSICGEECAIEYCQQCGMKSDEQPDMIMMSRYADIDLDESPIVVLGCGHFFTTETIDGLVGLKNVYEQDAETGRFVALIENAQLAASVPQCPNCRWPIKQYVTQRYNRLINRAVIDEMSKRFIVSGQQELQGLEERLDLLEKGLEKSRKSLLPSSNVPARDAKAVERIVKDVSGRIQKRYGEATILTNNVKSLQHKMATQHQPAHKLHEATVHALTRNSTLDAAFANMTIKSSAIIAKRDCDRRITAGGQLLEIRVGCLVLEDKFDIARAVKLKAPASALELDFKGGSPVKRTGSFLQDCKKLISNCISESLPKLAVEATLYYARVAQLYGSSGLAKDTDRERAVEYRNTAKDLLKKAEELCKNSFRDRDTLLRAVVNATTMLNSEFYEAVSKEEMDAIKRAMVSGPRGIATHSGHWYNCVNGHPFAIGECGMPMELAHCPECGEPVGGQSHTAVAGVTRASNMEH